MEFVVFVVMTLILVPRMHLVGLVWARICSSVVNAFLTTLNTHKYCGLPAGAVMFAIVRPLIGTLLMCTFVYYSGSLNLELPLQLVVSVLIGVLTYSVWCLVTWRIAGRPQGLESTLLDILQKR